MNGKIKTFFIGIFTAVVGVFAFVFRNMLQSQRNTIDSTRNSVEELKRAAEQQQYKNGRIVEAAREQQSNNRTTITGIDEALDTIAEIRKNQKYVEDDNILDQWYCCELFSDNGDNTK